MVVFCPHQRTFRIATRPTCKDRLACVWGSRIFFSKIKSSQWIDLGPGVKQHTIFAHALAGDAEFSEISYNLGEVICSQSVD